MNIYIHKVINTLITFMHELKLLDNEIFFRYFLDYEIDIASLLITNKLDYRL
jgi:hypothetical protein